MPGVLNDRPCLRGITTVVSWPTVEYRRNNTPSVNRTHVVDTKTLARFWYRESAQYV